MQLLKVLFFLSILSLSFDAFAAVKKPKPDSVFTVVDANGRTIYCASIKNKIVPGQMKAGAFVSSSTSFDKITKKILFAKIPNNSCKYTGTVYENIFSSAELSHRQL